MAINMQVMQWVVKPDETLFYGSGDLCLACTATQPFACDMIQGEVVERGRRAYTFRAVGYINGLPRGQWQDSELYFVGLLPATMHGWGKTVAHGIVYLEMRDVTGNPVFVAANGKWLLAPCKPSKVRALREIVRALVQRNIKKVSALREIVRALVQRDTKKEQKHG